MFPHRSAQDHIHFSPKDDNSRFGKATVAFLATIQTAGSPQSHKPNKTEKIGIPPKAQTTSASTENRPLGKNEWAKRKFPEPESRLFPCGFLDNAGPSEHAHELSFHFALPAIVNPFPSHQHNVDRLGDFVLKQAKGFSQQASSTMADNRFLSDLLFADNHSQTRIIPLGRKPPIHNRNVGRHTLASLLEIVKFLSAENALSRAEEKSLRFLHETAYTGVKRLRPFLRRLANMARPLRLEFRLRNPCCRFRRIFDGWYVRFISQLLIYYLAKIFKFCFRNPLFQSSSQRLPGFLPQRKREERITTKQRLSRPRLKIGSIRDKFLHLPRRPRWNRHKGKDSENFANERRQTAASPRNKAKGKP